MKKFFTLISLTILSVFGFSQTHLTEDFSGNQMPPSGWTIDGYSSQWSVSETNNSGGTAPEAKFTYTNGNSITRLVSPEVDLTGIDAVTLKFKFFYDHYSNPAPALGIATKSNGGDWNIAWSITPTGNVGPATQFVEITTDDLGAADFQFCIFLQGNFYNLDYVFIDDIMLYTPANTDAELTSITTPQFIGGPTEVTGTITNYGMDEITLLNLSWQVDDGEITETELDGLSIASNTTYNYTCNGMLDLPIGSYELKVWINSVNGVDDENPSNNMLSKNINMVSHTVDQTPLLEEFTSSTCSPCAIFNSEFTPWNQDHEEEIVLVKYQMDWPGSGDIYYTEEGGVRKTFYGVSYVPDLYGNGAQVSTDIGAVQSFFDAAVEEAGLMSVVGSHSIDGTNIEVTANILPYANFTNTSVYIVVFEYTTTGNVGSNGETEFHHVMMKMLPDANGTTMDLTDRVPVSITESFDMASTNVEEMSDLGVAIFVQEDNTTVFQSIYSLEDEVYASEARLEDVQMDGNSLDGFDSETFTYDVNLPSNTTEIPELVGLPIDENSIVIEVPATELPGTSTIDVFGQDLITHNTYEFNFTLGVGLEESAISNLAVYPNPASDHISISKLPNNSIVSVSDMSGRVVYRVKTDSQKMNISLSDFENGVYTLSCVTNNQRIVRRFTVAK